MSQPLHLFSIVYNAQIKRAKKLADEICAFLNENGQRVSACGSIQERTLQRQISEGAPDAVIVLGGDGTMLRASHLCAPQGIPITGINLGTFGFLMEIQPQEWQDFLPRMISGDYRIESRMLLEAEHLRGKKSMGSWLVVNEVVVCRGEFVRPIRVEATVDGYAMASYVADGLIAATPTGSTAYALAAGGAILPPTQRNIIIVPIAPHLSPDQSIILSEGACVSFRVRSSHQAVFSVDGHDPVKMKDDDIVEVKSSSHNSNYIRFFDPGFFYRNLNRFLEQNPSFPNSREQPA
jgi:NAD+ kinase